MCYFLLFGCFFFRFWDDCDEPPRFLFLEGLGCADIEEEGASSLAAEELSPVDLSFPDGFGTVGSGQVMSFAKLEWQNGRTCS